MAQKRGSLAQPTTRCGSIASTTSSSRAPIYSLNACESGPVFLLVILTARFELVASPWLLADPGSSVTVRDKKNAVEYLG
jgi:hypothetical protein